MSNRKLAKSTSRKLTVRQAHLLDIAGRLDKLSDNDYEDLKVIIFDLPWYRSITRIRMASLATNNQRFYTNLDHVLSWRWPDAALSTKGQNETNREISR